jgi:DNA-binding XRE family transcriptional regulator
MKKSRFSEEQIINILREAVEPNNKDEIDALESIVFALRRITLAGLRLLRLAASACAVSIEAWSLGIDALGLTQEQLAARCQLRGLDISRGTLSQIEAQLRCVVDSELLLLAKVLRVSADELLRGRRR